MAGTILITGPTSGLGKALAKALAPDNQLILVGRNLEKMQNLAGNAGKIIAITCDLSDLDDVFRAAREIQPYSIDVFISNAGILGFEKCRKNSHDLEQTFMINYLSHYILQTAALETLFRNEGLIINIVSMSYRWYSLDFDDFQSVRKYSPMKSYSRSKRMLLLLGEWLAGQGLKTCSVDPGIFASGISRSRGKIFNRMYDLGKGLMKTPARTAREVTSLLDSRLEGIPAGALLSKGKVIDYIHQREEIGKLIETTISLCGVDVEKRIQQIKSGQA